MIENSCYNCTKRHIACHDSCEEYKQYKLEKERLSKAKEEQKLVADHFRYRYMRNEAKRKHARIK